MAEDAMTRRARDIVALVRTARSACGCYSCAGLREIGAHIDVETFRHTSGDRTVKWKLWVGDGRPLMDAPTPELLLAALRNPQPVTPDEPLEVTAERLADLSTLQPAPTPVRPTEADDDIAF